jgi:uncharacterized protein YqeY
MNIKEQLTQDIKKALLEGDKFKATVLRGLKSTILYAEVAEGKRETGLQDDQIITLLQKEAKKRQDSIDMYAKAGEQERADKELAEKEIIASYLPAQLLESEIAEHVDAVIADLNAQDSKSMGQVIGAVKARTGGAADGATVARLTKERLG